MPCPPFGQVPVTSDLGSLLAQHHDDPRQLVQILREWQALHGWLPRDSLQQMAQALGQTLAHVEGVAGFYRFFHTRPVGAYRVLFSDNVTDRLLGSEALMADLCRRLGVAPGKLSADGMVSVDTTSCTGLCDNGPAGRLLRLPHVVPGHRRAPVRLAGTHRVRPLAADRHQDHRADAFWRLLTDLMAGRTPHLGHGLMLYD